MRFVEYTATYARYIAHIEHGLKAAFEKCPDSTLRKAMQYSVQAGGKRIRPVLALATCEMLGGRWEDACPFACGIELIHTYSLIHDDLPCMDDDDLRRGKPTNHKVFGEAMAVLAGDGLLSLAFEYMLCQPDWNQQKHNALCAIAKGCGVSGMVLGQVEDMEGEHHAMSYEALQAMHQKKTGALITAACLAGGYAAGASAKDIGNLQAYGHEVGLAFQITDDLLDCTASTATLGKTAGKDQQAGKSTYVTVLGETIAREKAVAAVRAAVQSIESYGDKAWFLREFASKIVLRAK